MAGARDCCRARRVSDVKRLELAYHENNQREFELTKHISLRQLSLLALLNLKATGECE